MVDAIQSALSGLYTQAQTIEKAAEDVASYPQKQKIAEEFEGTKTGYSRMNSEEVPPFLEESLVSILEASVLYKANAKVIQIAQEAEDSLLDVLS